MLLGVDAGGTFTDAVILDGEEIFTAKAPTTPQDQSDGVLAAIEIALERAGADPGQIAAFSHGMTVGTNALLQRSGARTALIATAGFTDLLEIARQDRPRLYHLCAERPPPLSPPELRIGVAERVGPAGIVEPLSDAEVERVVERVGELECEAVAICLLFSYLDPSHERRLAAALRTAHPGLAVSVSSEVIPRFREYERCSTTVIDAYLSPVLGRYLGRLGERCRSGGLPEPSVMRSSGGLATLEEARSGAAWNVLSGPAGGAVGASALARLSAAPDALGFDMGGTSCDVCLVEAGEVRRSSGRMIGERPLGLPMVDVHTVGAGGGSIGWTDGGGALSVGPRSAGAEPGPASYGRGGTEPTVTDANLVLGYLGAGARLAGGIELDLDAAEAAVAALGSKLGLDPVETAEGIIRVANAEMLRALRVVSVERGVDPRGFALIAFGGAGGMHAAALASDLGVGRLICPRAAGVLSALGLTSSERRRDLAQTVMLRGSALRAETIAAHVAALSEHTGGGLAADRRIEVNYELRYRGQSFELEVGAGPEPSVAELGELFAAAHERRYGYSDAGAEIELVGIRVAAIEPGDMPALVANAAAEPTRSSRRARFGGAWLQTEILTGEPAPGTELEGPCVLELPDTTLVLPPGAEGVIDERGSADLLIPAGDGAVSPQ